MRIKDGFTLETKDGQNVIAAKDRSAVLDATISLNETSAFLWNLCKDEISKQQMLEALLESFEMSTVLALSNIDVFIKTMKEYGIIEE